MFASWRASVLWLLAGYMGVLAAVDQSAVRRIPVRYPQFESSSKYLIDETHQLRSHSLQSVSAVTWPPRVGKEEADNCIH